MLPVLQILYIPFTLSLTAPNYHCHSLSEIIINKCISKILDMGNPYLWVIHTYKTKLCSHSRLNICILLHTKSSISLYTAKGNYLQVKSGISKQHLLLWNMTTNGQCVLSHCQNYELRYRKQNNSESFPKKT